MYVIVNIHVDVGVCLDVCSYMKAMLLLDVFLNGHSTRQPGQ